ncbi:serine hydrolase [Paenalkalicoccus suaedae]|uniref:Serine hydrolase n=1 Tax=Paenalkalicoccus suaedae TaxID=2592382 RepID=A0A859FHU6_9BACI|nr:serine hydrolase [Paenalkalicoccus suaedae]QKS72651.1 serine hydrolase [Paenalkalicoccus suaedae]
MTNHRQKRLTIATICLSFILTLLLITPTASAKTVYLQEKALKFDVQPVVQNSTTFVELRGLCTALGRSVSWDSSTKKTTCEAEGSSFSYISGATTYELNKQTVSFSTRPRVINGRTMLGLREVSRVFGRDVHYLSETGDIILYKDGLTDNQKASLIDSQVKKLADARKFNGSVAVQRRGDLLMSGGYGIANAYHSIGNKTHTPFAIASITKGITGIAVMQLVEDGKINLNDKVSKYLLSVPNAGRMTVRQLLTHTAGLPWEAPNYRAVSSLIYTPGNSQRYSNVGYQLLGDIIAQASGMSYGQYVRENIFEPAKMSGAGFDINIVNPSIRAFGYEYTNGRYVRKTRNYAARGASGSIYATVIDLARLDQALRDDTLLSRSTYNTMVGRHAGDWGFGWQAYHAPDGRVTQLEGSTDGYRTYIRRHEGRTFAIIVLANDERSKPAVVGSLIESIIRL